MYYYFQPWDHLGSDKRWWKKEAGFIYDFTKRGTDECDQRVESRDTSYFMFSFELSRILCIQFIETRNVNDLSRTVIDKMDMVAGQNGNNQLAQFQMNHLHQNKDASIVWMSLLAQNKRKVKKK